MSEGFDPSGPNDSQGYITEVATRAVIFIEADNPSIGLMCIMPVGMAEVSTCQITVYEGQHVKKVIRLECSTLEVLHIVCSLGHTLILILICMANSQA